MSISYLWGYKRANGALERPKARDINCRPVVKYAYDQYTGEYTKELRVKNVSESTFDESFISGFSGSDGQTIWNQCRALQDCWIY